MVCFAVVACKNKMSFIERIKYLCSSIIPCIVLFFIFDFFKIFHGVFDRQHLIWDFNEILPRMFLSLKAFIDFILFTANWNIIWLMLLLSFIMNVRKIIQDFKVIILVLVVLLWLSVPFILSLFTKGAGNVISPHVLPRLLIHYFPIVVALIVILNYQDRQ